MFLVKQWLIFGHFTDKNKFVSRESVRWINWSYNRVFGFLTIFIFSTQVIDKFYTVLWDWFLKWVFDISLVYSWTKWAK